MYLTVLKMRQNIFILVYVVLSITLIIHIYMGVSIKVVETNIVDSIKLVANLNELPTLKYIQSVNRFILFSALIHLKSINACTALNNRVTRNVNVK